MHHLLVLLWHVLLNNLRVLHRDLLFNLLERRRVDLDWYVQGSSSSKLTPLIMFEVRHKLITYLNMATLIVLWESKLQHHTLLVSHVGWPPACESAAKCWYIVRVASKGNKYALRLLKNWVRCHRFKTFYARNSSFFMALATNQISNVNVKADLNFVDCFWHHRIVAIDGEIYSFSRLESGFM